MSTQIKPGAPPFARLHLAITTAVPSPQRLHADTFDIMSVCVKESMGNPYFCKCDSLYKVNMRALTQATGVSEREWLNHIIVKEGPNKGQIPKFRFETPWYKIQRDYIGRNGITKLDIVTLSCSFGLAQKGALYLHSGKMIREQVELVQKFAAYPDMQLRQCAADLNFLYASSHGNKPLMFTRYNAGGTMKHVTTYGEQAQAYALQFRKVYLQQVGEKNA